MIGIRLGILYKRAVRATCIAFSITPPFYDEYWHEPILTKFSLKKRLRKVGEFCRILSPLSDGRNEGYDRNEMADFRDDNRIVVVGKNRHSSTQEEKQPSKLSRGFNPSADAESNSDSTSSPSQDDDHEPPPPMANYG